MLYNIISGGKERKRIRRGMKINNIHYIIIVIMKTNNNNNDKNNKKKKNVYSAEEKTLLLCCCCLHFHVFVIFGINVVQVLTPLLSKEREHF